MLHEMLHDTDPIFISPWTGNAHVSVITHCLTSDIYVILIKEIYHIIAFTGRPLELWTGGVVSYAPLKNRNNSGVISKGVQTMEAEVYFYVNRVDKFVAHTSVSFSNLSQIQLQLCVLPWSVLRPTLAHTASPRPSLKLHTAKILSKRSLTVVLCSPYLRTKW
jgi:hypothetical protein